MGQVMGKLNLPKQDPTLAAIDAAMERIENARPRRGYFGTHSIGEECERAAWMDFHWCVANHFDAATLKRFEDGHLGEDIQVKRLRLVKGVELVTVDPSTGGQLGFVDLDGHLRGHCDGHIKGLLQAPKTLHVWEHKQVSDKVQKELEKAITDHGESEALKAWNIKYYAQAQVYMHQFKIKRHYLTAANPGGRKTISVRTHYNKDDATYYIERAQRIIKANAPDLVNRISVDQTFYKCKWCNAHAVCYGQEFPQANCRTCVNSTPVADGQWHCDKWNALIPIEAQRDGCDEHVFIPDLVPGELTDTDEENTFVEYTLPDGRKYRNGKQEMQSHELASIGLAALSDEVQQLKKSSAAG